ncbi:alpha/beta hydrolase [uncultured Paraglaciecola sp.]|uniref:alpha/beta fold hydrolase n=1 Tax=uncultured Paraglaciecola sp. TaxID=1765024 RepID=UPI0030DD8EC2|tara:strand:- start:6559 stop:7488 length:930 start_codon:yes stop_codon:yes gene_type:complete
MTTTQLIELNCKNNTVPLQIAYDTFGTEQNRPLVLIMGLGAQRIFWEDEFCQLVAEQGFWVIRFDNRDVGESTYIDDQFTPNLLQLVASGLLGAQIPIPYTLLDMANDVVCLMEYLNVPKAHIVGASMGGMIAQILAIEYPQKVLSLTSIMSSTGNKKLHKPNKDVVLKLLKPMPKTRDKGIASGIEFWRTLHGNFYTFDWLRTSKLINKAYDRGVSSQGVLRQFAAILASKDRTSALNALSLPTLVIHGDADPMLPVSNGHATASAISGAKLRIYAGMGHTLPTELWQQIVGDIAQVASLTNNDIEPI